MSKSSPQPQAKNLRVALACDWLTTPGGAEKVLLELHRMYPEAPIYTSQYSKKGINWFDDAEVHTGWLQIFPASLRKILGPLRQIYFSHLDLSDYDLVISVTGAEAKAIKARQHLCYCHVPTQYYWQMYDKYVDNPGFGIFNPIVRFLFKLLVKPLRKADYKSAQRPDQFITISTYAQNQIQKYYHRDSIIIAPPVDISQFSTAKAQKSTTNPQPAKDFCTDQPALSTTYPQNTPKFCTETSNFSTKTPKKSTEIQQKSTAKTKFSTTVSQKSTSFAQKTKSNPQVLHRPSQTSASSGSRATPHAPTVLSPQPYQYYIIACRQVIWKKVDLAIQACAQAKVPLLVVGDGPEHTHLVKLAEANDAPLIKFLPWLQSNELAQYLKNAKAYLFPSLEPFGIAAVEALAAGCPVIAYAEGGSRDFVQDGKNGLLFRHQTAASLVQALQKFEQLDFNRTKIPQTAKKFSTTEFRHHITQIVNQTIRSTSQSHTHQAKPTPGKQHQKKGLKHENH